MYQIDSAKSLFQLQTDLINMKIDMAINSKIDQVVQQIVDLKHEMHREMSDCRHEMLSRLSAVETALSSRLSAVETALSSRLSDVEATIAVRNQIRNEIRVRLLDYIFKAGWMLLGTALTFAYFISR